MEENISKKLAKFNVPLKKAIYYYLLITKPIHKLADRRVELLAEILYLYTTERKNFARESDTWKKVFSKESRADIRDLLDMPKQVFSNYLTEFRKKGVIVNNEISPAYNPSISKDCTGYEVTFRFNIIDGK